MLNFEKNVWRYGEEVTLLICFTVYEKTARFMDGWTTDARVTTGALMCSSKKQS